MEGEATTVKDWELRSCGHFHLPFSFSFNSPDSIDHKVAR
jgi:hypothetical protein